MGKKRDEKRTDLSCIPLFYLGGYTLIFGIGFVFLLLAFFAPVAGIVMGILGLCLKRKQMGKIGIGFSVAAIVIPVVFVVTMIILLSTGVFVLRLM